MKQTLNRIGLVVILTLTNISMSQAQNAIVQGDIAWFTSNTSSMLNRSSVELATNHTNRGIQFAYRALSEKLNPVDELVAYHNLCIGYLASDRPDYAVDFCARTKELAQGPYAIARIRGAFRLHEVDTNNGSQQTLSAVQVIFNNIQQQSSDTRITLLTK